MYLRQLMVGQGFKLRGPGGYRGVVLNSNDAEVKCKIDKGEDGVATAHWSPFTEVDCADGVEFQDTPLGQSYECPCGKVCSSKSGYTLHMKVCRVAG